MAPIIFLSVAIIISLASYAHAQQNPGTITGSGADACITASNFNDICASLTPDFTALPFKTQASCLCYGWINTVAWEPSVYDQAFATCNSYLSTEAPDLYSQVLSAYSTSAIPTAPCQLAGNVQAATTTDTLGTAAFDSHLSSVIAATPGLLSSAIDATPTGGFGGGQQSGMITGGNGNSLFPTPTGGAGPGVLLTPGTAAGSDAQTTAGGGGASQQTMNGGGQFGQGSNTAGGSSSQPTMPGTNDARTLKANTGLLLGLVAAIAAL